MSLKYHIRINPDAANQAHAKLIRMTGEGKRVLELGCHAGDVSREIAGRGCTVIGVELDSEAAALARECCQQVMAADLDDLDFDTAFKDLHFDVVIIGDVLEHLADPLRVLVSARKLLAPGGCVLVSVPNIAHVSIRLALLRGDFPYGAAGILDRTHRRFFTRSSLARMLAEAGLFARVWDRVTDEWPREKIQEALELMGVRAEPGIMALLSSADASSYQYVVKAEAAPPPVHDATLIIVCPGMPAEKTIMDWIEIADGQCSLAMVLPSLALDQGRHQALAEKNISVITFGPERGMGDALMSALPSPLSGKVVFIHQRINPDRALLSALLENMANAEQEDVIGAFAEIEPGPGAGRAWWKQEARPPRKNSEAGLEFCQAINLAVPASWFAETPFAAGLPYPWVMVDWFSRMLDRQLKFIKIEGASAKADFAPDLKNMSRQYRRLGAMLADIERTRPHLAASRLPRRVGAAKRLRQIPRRLPVTINPGGDHRKFFSRHRAIALLDGYAEGKRH